MNFDLSEEHKAVQEAAKSFAESECKPGVIERDRDQIVGFEQLKQLGELGFMGMMVDPKYGGSGMDTLSYVLAIEEISKIDASISVAMSVNNSLVCWGLENFGSEDQKQKYQKLTITQEVQKQMQSPHFPLLILLYPTIQQKVAKHQIKRILEILSLQ